jgi:hypothetical protein
LSAGKPLFTSLEVLQVLNTAGKEGSMKRWLKRMFIVGMQRFSWTKRGESVAERRATYLKKRRSF